MRVMVLVKATDDSERGFERTPDTAAMREAMGRFNDDLRAAGIFVVADGLQPTSQGKRIAFNGEHRDIIEGPFAPAGHQVAGFWIWEVRDMEEAVQWARRCPNPMPGPSEIEIRPFHALDDLM